MGVGPSAQPGSSQALREPHEGDLIEIKEIWSIDEAKRMRGRLVTGSWITISDTQIGYVWAQPEAPTVEEKAADKAEAEAPEDWERLAVAGFS